MAKRMICAAAILFFGVSLIAAGAYAETAKDPQDAKAKWSELELKKSSITETYKFELDKLNKDIDIRLDDIKKDFHSKRDAVLKEKSEKEKALLDNYKDNMRPIREEEKRMIELRGTAEPMNFAKPKTER